MRRVAPRDFTGFGHLAWLWERAPTPLAPVRPISGARGQCARSCRVRRALLAEQLHGGGDAAHCAPRHQIGTRWRRPSRVHSSVLASRSATTPGDAKHHRVTLETGTLGRRPTLTCRTLAHGPRAVALARRCVESGLSGRGPAPGSRPGARLSVVAALLRPCAPAVAPLACTDGAYRPSAPLRGGSGSYSHVTNGSLSHSCWRRRRRAQSSNRACVTS